MKIMIVGQKWLAAETLKMVRERGHTVTGVAVPDEDDRLAMVARELRLPCVVAEKVLREGDIPTGTDLIICAHAWCYITRGARMQAKHGGAGISP